MFKPNVEKLASKRKVKGLIKALDAHGDSEIRRKAARALGEIGDKRAVEPLIQSLKSDFYSRKDIANALKKLGGDKKATEKLAIDLYRDKEPTSASEALIELGNEQAINAIVDVFKKADFPVRELGYGSMNKVVMAKIERDIREIEPKYKDALRTHAQRLCVRRNHSEEIYPWENDRVMDNLEWIAKALINRLLEIDTDKTITMCCSFLTKEDIDRRDAIIQHQGILSILSKVEDKVDMVIEGVIDAVDKVWDEYEKDENGYIIRVRHYPATERDVRFFCDIAEFLAEKGDGQEANRNYDRAESVFVEIPEQMATSEDVARTILDKTEKFLRKQERKLKNTPSTS